MSLKRPVDEQVKLFKELQTARDVANLLEIEYSRLVYFLYKVPANQKYYIFNIPKKNGGVREICSPTYAIKLIQRRLADVLLNIYKTKPTVYGYVRKKSIALNAMQHKKKKYVINVDLKDFFPSINFGRVRGLFLNYPYFLSEEAATVLAQICCFNNYIPQGAPTSPIISNMICAKLDSQIQNLAIETKCYYTRYADDITFSTSVRNVSEEIIVVNPDKSVTVGKSLRDVIEGNGFEVNEDKVSFLERSERQVVTGLTVNIFPNVKRNYIRQIRAMLHAWDKFGITNAEKDFRFVHDKKYRNPKLKPPTFKQVVKGKINFLGMVRGKKDRIYIRFIRKYYELLSRDQGIPPLKAFSLDELQKPHVYTEGITDVYLLNTAWKKLFGTETPCPFIVQDSHPTRKSNPEGSSGGVAGLKNFMNNLRDDYPHIAIGVFDRDMEGIKEYEALNKYYVEDKACDWKLCTDRKAGALLLTVSPGREEYARYQNFCIEYYFPDDVLNQKTSEGYGLTFEFPQIVKIIAGVTIKEVSTIVETRKIKEGKVIFSEKIVPSLDRALFKPFRPLLLKIIDMIRVLEN